jgi:ribonuclease HII
LSKKKREELYDYIRENAAAYGIGEGSVEEIDRINILQATMKAMHRALDEVYRKKPFTHINVDGTYFTPYLPPGGDDDCEPITHSTLIKGDDRDRAIAAASILAKVYRDRYVERLLEEDPELNEYGLGTNMGYGTAKHIQAIRVRGLTPYHRKSFHIKSLQV